MSIWPANEETGDLTFRAIVSLRFMHAGTSDDRGTLLFIMCIFPGRPLKNKAGDAYNSSVAGVLYTKSGEYVGSR